MSVKIEVERLLVEAVREALLFLRAPPDSPRLWPVSRANLAMLLQRALVAAESNRLPTRANGDKE